MKKTLKDKVLYCLEKYPDTRNSDVTLTSKIWGVYHQEQLDKFKEYYDDGKYPLESILLGFMLAIPREDSVKRVRATIQNVEKLFPPTNLDVRVKRALSHKDQPTWHDQMEEYGIRDTGVIIDENAKEIKNT